MGSANSSGSHHTEMVNFAQVNEDEFAGMVKQESNIGSRTWIIDTGATNHMAYNASLISSLHELPYISPITLPDGTIKYVNKGGDVHIASVLTLKDCLLVDSFKCNLLSVSKCLKSSQYSFNFTDEYCLLQDQQSKKVVGAAKLIKGLYLLNDESFLPAFVNRVVDSMNKLVKSSAALSVVTAKV